MNKWKDVVVPPEATLVDTLKCIDRGALQIALVADAGGKLLGTVTDGDVRRGLLRGLALSAPVSAVMNATPFKVAPGDDRRARLAQMQARHLRHVPIVDDRGVLVGLETIDELRIPPTRQNPVVVMAGGQGIRLRPLTADCPKPMLKLGGRPILESILLNFIEQGFVDFHFSVNYLAHVVRDYFHDGAAWGVSIRYLEETHPLGTAGPLATGTLRGASLPIIVMNGDVLTRMNFVQLLEFHRARHADATVCVREHDVQVPYGVLKLDGEQIVEIQEKPVTRHFVNAGVYVLGPEVLSKLVPDAHCDMPELLERVIATGGKISAFPLHEYWVDIGQMSDFERAANEFSGQQI